MTINRKSIILPLETHNDICVQGFPDDREVRVRIEQGLFVRAGLFLFSMSKGVPDKPIDRGAVKITLNRGSGGMTVEIRRPNGKAVRVKLDASVCDEIKERIDQINALLHSYDFDDDAIERSERLRDMARSRRHEAA